MTKPPPDEPALSPWLQRWRSFVVAPLRRANDESRVYLESPAGRGLDRKTVAVLLIACLALTLHYYQCRVDQVEWLPWLLDGSGLTGAAASVRGWMEAVQASEIDRWTFWALAGFVSYGVLPALVIRLIFRERLADYGLKLRGAFADGWVYLVMLGVVGPLVWAVSHNAHFQETYPFYRHPAARRCGRIFGVGRWRMGCNSWAWSFSSEASWSTACAAASAPTASRSWSCPTA